LGVTECRHDITEHRQRMHVGCKAASLQKSTPMCGISVAQASPHHCNLQTLHCSVCTCDYGACRVAAHPCHDKSPAACMHACLLAKGAPLLPVLLRPLLPALPALLSCCTHCCLPARACPACSPPSTASVALCLPSSTSTPGCLPPSWALQPPRSTRPQVGVIRALQS
jgi:hypothetical protein